MRNKVLTSLLIVACLVCLANVAYLWAQPPAVPANTLNNLGHNAPYFLSENGYSVGANEVISSLRAATFTTLNTGQGDYELYAMDQDVDSTADPVFASVDADLYRLSTGDVTDILEYPQTEASYIIWVDNSTGTPAYYAKNGATGAIDYSGSVFSTIFQNSHDNCGDGGVIEIKTGLYIVTKTLNVTKHGMIIRSESMWRGPASSGDVQVTGLKLAANTDMFNIIGRKCLLEKLCLDGVKTVFTTNTNDGISTAIDGSLDLHINDVYIFSFAGMGIRFTGGASSFTNVYIEYCGRMGLYVNSPSGTRNSWIGGGCYANGEHGIYDDTTSGGGGNRYIGTTLANNGGHGIILEQGEGKVLSNSLIQDNDERGVWLYGTKNAIISNNVFDGNCLVSNNVNSVIYMSSRSGTHCSNNTIIGNQVFSAQGNKPKYGIEDVDVNQDYNVISNNIIQNTVSAQMNILGASTLVRYNPGYPGIGETRYLAGNLEMWNSTAWVIIGP